MDDDDVTTYDDVDGEPDEGETWIAEQARLVLLEDGS
jgi:hypothetical protein